MQITEKLQTTTNLCRTHVDLMPLSGAAGFNSEPALSLCNDTVQELLSHPYAWKFNRVEMPMLVTAPNRQDCVFAGATAFTMGSTSRGAGIGLAANSAIAEVSNTVTVTTLEPHNFSVGDTVFMTGNTVAAYNSTLVITDSTSTWTGGWIVLSVPTSTSFTFTHATSGLAVSGAPGINDFGWLESGTMSELNNNSAPQNIRYLRAVGEIQPSRKVANPEEVTVLKDNGDGSLKIRFKEVPGTIIWCANLVYQAAAPLKTDLSQTWAPFPDSYGFVYRQMFLARCYRYTNSPKEPAEYQKAEAMIGKALGLGDAASGDIHVTPACSLLDW